MVGLVKLCRNASNLFSETLVRTAMGCSGLYIYAMKGTGSLSMSSQRILPAALDTFQLFYASEIHNKLGQSG